MEGKIENKIAKRASVYWLYNPIIGIFNMSMIPFDKIKENCETIQMYQEDTRNKNKQDDILKILCSDKTDEQKIFEMKQIFGIRNSSDEEFELI